MTPTTNKGLSTEQRRARLEKAVVAGFKMCRAQGVREPTLGNALWELIVESADTLKAMPDKELNWLRQRSNMPEYYDPMDYPDDHTRAPVPSKAAIDRLDVVFEIMGMTGGTKQIRDRRVVWSLASGLKPDLIARKARVKYNTLYDIRAKQLRIISHKVNALISGQARFDDLMETTSAA